MELEESVFPSPSMNVGDAAFGMTLPVSLDLVVGSPEADGLTVCALPPSLVTSTLNCSDCPETTVPRRAG